MKYTILISYLTMSFAYGQQLRTVEDHYVESGRIYSRGYFLRIDSSTETSFGPWTFWYESGQIKLETFEKESGYDALRYINFWTESGEQLLTNGNGILIEEYIDNIQDSSIYIIKDSLKEGYSWSYRPSISGKMFLFKNAYFKKGKENGWTSYFYETGKIMRKCVFENGEECGLDISYFTNGRIREIGMSKSYNKQGIWSYYDSLGHLVREETYENSYLKKFIDYYPNCCKKLEGQYILMVNIEKPVRRVLDRPKHKRTSTKRISRFKNMKDGTWIYYNINCQIMRKTIFKNKILKNGS